MKKSRVWQAIVPGTQNRPQDTLQIRKTPWHGATKQPPALNRMKKSRVWQAIVPGTQNKPQDTLQIRKTPWHGVTKQPPAVPLPGPNVTPEPNEKIKGLAGNCSRHTKQAARHPSNQENTLARRDETASCRPSAGQTSLLSRMKKSRVWQAIVPGTQNKPQDTLQIRKTPWHGVTKQPPAVPRVWQAIVPGTQNKPQDTLQIRKTPWHGVTKQPPAAPLPGPNVTPEPNENIKGLAGNCSRQTKKATRHPSNQENTLARRDETASCCPCARAKRHS